ncbi:MAG: hypothetical protein KGH88_10085, partial [Thaumarchaeota archaeon]|nr:hypothetical protein [Nitrososphaerota archaeon]
MSSSKDEIMRDLYESLSSKSKYMSADLDSVRSFLIELRQELEIIRTVYGNEEILSIMKKAEYTRYEMDLIKPELETLKSVLYELKSV